MRFRRFPVRGKPPFFIFSAPMNPTLNIKNIFLSLIDFDDFSFSISPEQEVVPDETLSKSIARHGILHPPIVKRSSPDLYTIIAGRKRLQSLRFLHNNNTASCLVVSRQIPEVDLFHLLLEEIQLVRQLTPVEKAIFLQKVTAVIDTEQIISEFLPRLDLAPHSRSIVKTLKLFELEKPILRSLHDGQLHETVAHDFILLTPGDRMVLFGIISSLRLSFSYQKKLLVICRELAGRNNTSIASLLKNDEVDAILQHGEANSPQKTKNLMLWLQGERMPRSTRAAAEFKRFTAALQLPQNVAIAHAPFFENDAMTLTITFQDRKSLQHAWDKIRHATYGNDH